MTIKEAKPKHYLIKIKDTEIEAKDIMESLADEAMLVGSDAIWYGKALKYVLRVFKKHEDPTRDIKKAIVCLINLLEKLSGKKYKFEEVKEKKKEEVKEENGKAVEIDMDFWR